MFLDRFQELTGREEADIELCENICDVCGREADDKCPHWNDTNECPLIKYRYVCYGE